MSSVYFIGAGPGDPDLLTLKAKRLIGQADVIIYADSLINPAVLAEAKPAAEVHGSAALTLEEITALMLDAVRAGKTVARLHSGDPSLYGTILEQMAVLRQHGIRFEIVPGVSSALAAAAALGAELTVSEVSQTVIFTRIEGRTPVPARERLRDLARHGATLVIFLSITRIHEVVDELLEGGHTPDCPVAVVYRVGWPDQQILRGSLADIADQVTRAGIRRQALILVGQVLDPALIAGALAHRSRLYDGSHSHGFRRSPDPPSPRGKRGKGDKGETVSGASGKSMPHGRGAPRGHPARPYSPAVPGCPQGLPDAPASERGVSDRQVGAIALVAATGRGAEMAGQLLAELPEARAYLPARYAPVERDADRVEVYAGPIRPVVEKAFQRCQGLVLFLAVGAAVRLLAGLLQDKRSDPAVVAVDDAGRFAVSLAGGHLGGANELAGAVAAALGATPVITTASDAHGLPAVDLLGRDLGWRIDPASWPAAKRAAAALVNGDLVAFARDGDWPDPWPAGTGLPTNLDCCTTLEELREKGCTAALVVSDRLLPPSALPATTVLYRPPSLVVGIGCRRGVTADEIETAVRTTLDEAGLVFASVRNLATIDLKADEPGLRAFAAAHDLPIAAFPAAALATVSGVEASSEIVRRITGGPAVCEPAALLSAGGGTFPAASLLMPKRKTARVTVAVARSVPPGRRVPGTHEVGGRGGVP